MSETAATQMPDRKSMQAAIKDINAILEPKPKLNVIGGADFLSKQIVGAIAACIGEKDGNLVWTDERAGKLAPETIATYETIVTVQQPEAQAEAEPEQTEPEAEAQAEAAGQDVYLTDGEECTGFVKSLGPKEGEEACGVCSKLAACAEKAAPSKEEKPKAEKAAKPKAEKKPAEEKYSYVLAFRDAIRSGPLPLKELVAKTLDLYKAHGGEADETKARRNVDTFLRPLLALGFAKDDGGIISLS